VPGLDHVASALVVEMQLAAGVPYHTLPSPLLVPPAYEPNPPPLLLWASAEALALLLPPGRDLEHASGTYLESTQRDVAAIVPSLLHVALRAASGHVPQMPAEHGWWQPCALHVQIEGGDGAVSGSSAASDWAQLAALSVMRNAASQWPLVKVSPSARPLQPLPLTIRSFR
jgi:hypothetical protein